MIGRDIAATARKYLGTPWRHQGRDRVLGLDCIGLLVVVAQDLDLEYDDTTTYTMRPVPAEMIAALNGCCDPVDEPQEGDIMAFFAVGDGWPQHVAIKTREGLIHTTRSGMGKVVEEEFTEEWKRKLEGAWRFRWQR